MKEGIAALLLIAASVGSFVGLFCTATGKIQVGGIVWNGVAVCLWTLRCMKM